MSDITLRQPTHLRVPERKRITFGAPERIAVESTGEVLEVIPQTVQAGDADFVKFWIANILSAVDEIGNAKMKVLWYILSNVDPMNNLLLQTVKEIARGSGVSRFTVMRTLAVLDDHDIVRRRLGFLQLNPNVMMTGSSGKRRALLIRFEQLELPLADDTFALQPGGE